MQIEFGKLRPTAARVNFLLLYIISARNASQRPQRPPAAMITTLALDLEGTLISNAMSQIPRPGLNDFLVRSRALFDRVVIYTAVAESRFRGIAAQLAAEGFVSATLNVAKLPIPLELAFGKL